MVRATTYQRITPWLLAVAGGACFQFGGCVGGAVDLLGNLNACGTLLNCDPRIGEFVTSGIDGPGVYPDEDPFCTYPPFCTTAQDPIFGGLSGAANP